MVPAISTATLDAIPIFAFLNDLFILSDKRLHQYINEKQGQADGTTGVAPCHSARLRYRSGTFNKEAAHPADESSNYQACANR